MYHVLIVCSGNVCRSPLAERLLRKWLHERGAADRFDIASAGLRASVGSAMHPETVSDAERLGADATDFRARQATEPLIRTADLVLASTVRQRTAILRLSPAAVRRTFTLREFAAAVDGIVDPSTPADMVARAATRRGRANRDKLDVNDPVDQPPAAFREVARQIEASTKIIGFHLAATIDDPAALAAAEGDLT